MSDVTYQVIRRKFGWGWTDPKDEIGVECILETDNEDKGITFLKNDIENMKIKYPNLGDVRYTSLGGSKYWDLGTLDFGLEYYIGIKFNDMKEKEESFDVDEAVETVEPADECACDTEARSAVDPHCGGCIHAILNQRHIPGQQLYFCGNRNRITLPLNRVMAKINDFYNTAGQIEKYDLNALLEIRNELDRLWYRMREWNWGVMTPNNEPAGCPYKEMRVRGED